MSKNLPIIAIIAVGFAAGCLGLGPGGDGLAAPSPSPTALPASTRAASNAPAQAGDASAAALPAGPSPTIPPTAPRPAALPAATDPLPPSPMSPPTTVTIQGRQIYVNGQPFMMRGVGYAPTPIGRDPETLNPGEDFFSAGYAATYTRDLELLRDMGANTVRLWGWAPEADHTAFLDAAYNGGSRPVYVIAAYWLNASQNLSDPDVRRGIINEFTRMVALHKDHPAILMWMIGNELNAPWMYGDSPALFSLVDEMAAAAHAEEGARYHPVTTPLADIDLIQTIRQRDPQLSNLDVWSVQLYRGKSVGGIFDDYAAASRRPLLITEYGIDAYDQRQGDEYEKTGPPLQAEYAAALWQEIEAHSAVCAGGSIMAFRDEWWKGKHGKTDAGHPGCPDGDPATHSDCGYPSASQPDGYANEEWWGLFRAVKDGAGPERMEPRAVVATLRSLWTRQVYLPLLENPPAAAGPG